MKSRVSDSVPGPNGWTKSQAIHGYPWYAGGKYMAIPYMDDFGMPNEKMKVSYGVLLNWETLTILLTMEILSTKQKHVITEKFGGWDPNGVRKTPLKIWEIMGN